MAPSARISPGQSRGDLTPGGGLTDSEGVLGQDGRSHGAGSGGLGRSRVLPWASSRRRPEEGRRRPGAGNPKAAVGGAWGAGRGPGSRCPGEPGEERRGRRKRPGPERERGGRTSPGAGPAPGAASGGLRAASPQGWEVAASAESDTGGTRGRRPAAGETKRARGHGRRRRHSRPCHGALTSSLPPERARARARALTPGRDPGEQRRVLLAWPLWPASPAHPPLSPFRACNPGPELGTRNKRQAWRWEALLRLQAGPWVSSLEGHLHSGKTSPEPAVE